MSRLLKFLLIFFVITGWIFSGWPQIFNPSTLFRTGFPSKIQVAQAVVTGPNYAGAAGTNGYTLPANAVGATETTCAGDNYGTTIVSGFWNTFGFAIPTGDTINQWHSG